jgi:hypothetical protein
VRTRQDRNRIECIPVFHWPQLYGLTPGLGDPHPACADAVTLRSIATLAPAASSARVRCRLPALLPRCAWHVTAVRGGRRTRARRARRSCGTGGSAAARSRVRCWSSMRRRGMVWSLRSGFLPAVARSAPRCARGARADRAATWSGVDASRCQGQRRLPWGWSHPNRPRGDGLLGRLRRAAGRGRARMDDVLGSEGGAATRATRRPRTLAAALAVSTAIVAALAGWAVEQRARARQRSGLRDIARAGLVLKRGAARGARRFAGAGIRGLSSGSARGGSDGESLILAGNDGRLRTRDLAAVL